jgi:hypothetical protein
VRGDKSEDEALYAVALENTGSATDDGTEAVAVDMVGDRSSKCFLVQKLWR